ncbi:hypothetical protein ACP70R_020912 [Stipagrostis hirtigluma subsp. patula]
MARNASRATVLAAVLTLNLLLATRSESCASCAKPPPVPAPLGGGGGGAGKCPVNALKLGACASVLGGLVSLELGQHQGSPSSKKQPCCELLGGLADLDAAVCLCTALRAKVLGIVDLSLPVKLSVLVNYCGKKVPAGFRCPS